MTVNIFISVLNDKVSVRLRRHLVIGLIVNDDLEKITLYNIIHTNSISCPTIRIYAYTFGLRIWIDGARNARRKIRTPFTVTTPTCTIATKHGLVYIPKYHHINIKEQGLMHSSSPTNIINSNNSNDKNEIIHIYIVMFKRFRNIFLGVLGHGEAKKGYKLCRQNWAVHTFTHSHQRVDTCRTSDPPWSPRALFNTRAHIVDDKIYKTKNYGQEVVIKKSTHTTICELKKCWYISTERDLTRNINRNINSLARVGVIRQHLLKWQLHSTYNDHVPDLILKHNCIYFEYLIEKAIFAFLYDICLKNN